MCRWFAPTRLRPRPPEIAHSRAIARNKQNERPLKKRFGGFFRLFSQVAIKILEWRPP
jgi:hypothetical protein